MNTFLSGAIALAAVAPAALAGNGYATSDWLGLDEELNSLASTVNLQTNGTDVGVLLRSSFLFSSDFDGGTGEDILGLALDDARLWANGTLGDFGWRLSMDFAENELPDPISDDPVPVTYLAKAAAGELGSNDYEANLQDAYANWNFSESVLLTWGRYRSPKSLSSTFHQDSLLFQQRTVLGDYGYFFDEGIMLSGNYNGQFGWYASAQNGIDGTDDDLNLMFRAEVRTGSGASKAEGAYDASNDANASFGATWSDDGETGSYWLVDAAGASGRLGYHAEFYGFDDDATAALGFATGASYVDLALNPEEANPWAATLSYLLTPEQTEIAVRYEDMDDSTDTTLLSAGLNYYMAGHNAKLQFGYTMVDSDNSDLDGSLISIGFTLGFEGYQG